MRAGWCSSARIEIVYVEPPLPMILGQNARRDHPVPEGVIRQLADKCQPPTFAEAHSLLICSGQEKRPHRSSDRTTVVIMPSTTMARLKEPISSDPA
jgi:hypothetical protein